jgi:hypothetical protein
LGYDTKDNRAAPFTHNCGWFRDYNHISSKRLCYRPGQRSEVVGVGVVVLVGVFVGVSVFVGVRVLVGVGVLVGVSVFVGVTVAV